jgi:dihydrofolate reductase
MRKLIPIVHVSLDGFVAGPNGELDGFEEGSENLEFVCKITESADAAMFGRKSFELLNEYWPAAKNIPGASKGTIAYSNWYNAAHKYVFSKTLKAGNSAGTTMLSRINSEEILQLKNQAGKDILIFGSPSITQSLIRLGLADSYWIFINPVIFASGIPLFSELNALQKLKLVSKQEFPNGEIALNYQSIV